MHVRDLIKLIPEQELELFAAETKVDHQVKKLHGRIIFQLILFSMLSRKRISLRVMEEFMRSASFKIFSANSGAGAKFNSLSVRISMINADFFEKIFNTCFERFSKYLKEEKHIIKYDSTMVALSSKLFQMGMRGLGPKSKTDKKQLKFSIGMKGSLPMRFKVFQTQEAFAEDVALKEAIVDGGHQNDTVVFDRGLKDRHTFDKFTSENVNFITRTSPRTRYIKYRSIEAEAKPKDATVTIKEDLLIHLKYRHPKKESPLYRLIKATIDTTGEEIVFLSNLTEISAYEIAALYKSRWEIETLFKFLKQELNLEHCVSRDINGIKVMMYMTLIVAILIIVYKKLNHLSSFKIAKLRMVLELEAVMMEQIVILCGGNPRRFKKLINDT